MVFLVDGCVKSSKNRPNNEQQSSKSRQELSRKKLRTFVRYAGLKPSLDLFYLWTLLECSYNGSRLSAGEVESSKVVLCHGHHAIVPLPSVVHSEQEVGTESAELQRARLLIREGEVQY